MEVLWYMNRIATAPLFPVAPPSPVFTQSTATSLKMYRYHDNTGNFLVFKFSRISDFGTFHKN